MDYTELFDRYIDGQLKGKELEDFERSLEINPELRGELEKYRILHEAAEHGIGQDGMTEEEYTVDKETDQISLEDISGYGKEKRGSSDSDMSDFEHVLKHAQKDYFGERKMNFKRLRLTWYAATAVLIIALSITTIFIVHKNQQRRTDLYAAFFKTYVKSDKIFELTRSSDDFYYAVKVFEAGDYSRATLLFSSLTDSMELRVYAFFYAGLTSMELGKWEEAINSFVSAIGCSENQMSYASRWYLGLCYLRIDDEESAKKQFEVLASEKNEYVHKARQILRILRRR